MGKIVCAICELHFTRKNNFRRHLKDDHNFSIPATPIFETTSALGRFFISTFKPNDHETYDYFSFMSQHSIAIMRILARLRPVKWCLSLTLKFYKILDDGEQLFKEIILNSLTDTSLMRRDVSVKFNSLVLFLAEKMDTFLSIDSGWIFDSIVSLDVKYSPYRPTSAGSYIPLPRKLVNSNSILNIKNEDNKCFLYSVLASLHPSSRYKDNVKSYSPFQCELNLQGITFPMKIESIPNFEALNNISVNVIGFQDGFTPLYMSKLLNPRHHVDLLLVKSEENSHYCWIKNLSKMLYSSTHGKRRKFFCHHCLNHFPAEITLHRHVQLCKEHKFQKTLMPKEKEVISFKDNGYLLPSHFCIFFNFEYKILPSKESREEKLQPCAYCFIIVDKNGNIFRNEVNFYRGKKVVKHFINALSEKIRLNTSILKKEMPIIMPKEDYDFDLATHCYLCNLPLEGKKYNRYSKFSGKYYIALHAECNFHFGEYVPVISYNLRVEDFQVILKELTQIENQIFHFEASPSGKQMFFSAGYYKFIDSSVFLNSSLDDVVKTLGKSNWAFPILNELINGDSRLRSLLTEKLILPNDYLGTNQIFVTEFPKLEDCYSSFSVEKITPETYEHSKNVWKAFGVKNMDEYLILYLKTNVALLAEIFQMFRKICKVNFQLDAVRFASAKALSWQAFLKSSKVHIKLITDINIYLFIEAGIRDGLSSVGNKRFVKANDPRCENFNASQPSSSIFTFQINDLYASAMREALPLGDFRFLPENEIRFLDLEEFLLIPKNSNKGYILQVDLEYPIELHDVHNMCPLAPEVVDIQPHIISPYSLSRLKQLGLKIPSKNEKLVTNLRNKSNYICHYRNLQFYMKQGLRVTKIHAILEFTQSDYIRSYIDYNAYRRSAALFQFERDFHHLCIDALCRKVFESSKQEIKIDLFKNPLNAKILIDSTKFQGFKIINKKLVAASFLLEKSKLDEPIFIKFTLLELSKLFMYEFMYEKLFPHFGDRLSLLLIDCDTSVFHIQSQDALQEIKLFLSDHFDFSNFPKEHYAYSEENKGVMNKIQIRYPNNPIKEAVALRAKNYSLLFENQGKLKNSDQSTMNRTLNHELYKTILFHPHLQYKFLKKSRNYDTSKTIKNKVNLSTFDDKRYFYEDGIESLALFHNRTLDFIDQNTNNFNTS